jgi:hypothetical protein
MNISDLQTALGMDTVDGIYGPNTRAAVLAMVTDGCDNHISSSDLDNAARQLQVNPRDVSAVCAVEANGAGFLAGRPKILFEPHRFSRATAHRFDVSNPTVSYPRWDKSRYPKDQAGRYAQLLEAVGLDVDAGFGSASYGMFQILGENYAMCGYDSPLTFVHAQAQSEGDQLAAFVAFLQNKGLDAPLRAHDWEKFAVGYNGTAAVLNGYPRKLMLARAALGT